MEIKDLIRDYVSRSDYTPLKPTELFKALSLNDKPAFDQALQQMLLLGTLVEVKNGKLCLPSDADLVVGRIHFRQSGAAVVFPEDGKTPVIDIPADETGVAFHGDQVVVRRLANTRERRFRMGPRGKAVHEPTQLSGRVIKILKRARTQLTGTLARTKVFFHVIPDDPRFVRNIIVADPKESSVKPTPKIDDKVVVELEEWKQRHLNPQGVITSVLGKSHMPQTEHAAVFVQYGLNKEFPPEVEAEALAVSHPVTQEQAAGRLDLRQKPVFTIDPDDAKDFDDALHLERLDDGSLKIGVHIADVSAYVKPNSHLDKEAQRRGNSTYLVGEVVPMLPHALSSGVCSLKEAEDRLTKSTLFTFNPRGELVDVEFANTVIRSIKRLTYKQAKLIMDEDDFQKIRETPPPPSHLTAFTGRPLKSLSNQELKLLQSHIRQMWSIAKRLRSARMRAGSLDLDMPEAKIYLDEKGYPERIVRIEHDESHQLIEEFMLLANEAVARAFNRGHMSAIHRVHPKPDAEKLDELRETLGTMGLRVGDLNQQSEVAKFLQLTREHPKGVFLRGLFLRSLKQACYRAVPDGHFGLAKIDYTHFTSPIRRYADFIVHRIFDAYLVRNALPSAPREIPPSYSQGQLAQIAEHISITEQNSTEAERQSVKNRLLEFFEIESKREPRKAFEAVITDVKNHGFFIELTESMAFGLVHISQLEDDFYVLDEQEQTLTGRRTHIRYGVGDKIKVEVEKVDRFKRQIDFVLSGDAVKTKRTPTAERPLPVAAQHAKSQRHKGKRPHKGSSQHQPKQHKGGFKHQKQHKKGGFGGKKRYR